VDAVGDDRGRPAQALDGVPFGDLRRDDGQAARAPKEAIAGRLRVEVAEPGPEAALLEVVGVALDDGRDRGYEARHAGRHGALAVVDEVGPPALDLEREPLALDI